MSDRLGERVRSKPWVGKLWKTIVVILVILGICALCVGISMGEENVSGFRAMVAMLCLNDNNYCLYLNGSPVQYLTKPGYCDKALSAITGQDMENFPDQGTFTANGMELTYSVREYQGNYQIITVEEAK